MAMTSVEVKVGIRTEISESTANGCLKIVEMFLNQHPEMTVIPYHYSDGDICLELVEEEDLDCDDEDEDDND